MQKVVSISNFTKRYLQKYQVMKTKDKLLWIYFNFCLFVESVWFCVVYESSGPLLTKIVLPYVVWFLPLVNQNFKFPIDATASQSTSKWVLCFQQTNFKTEFQGGGPLSLEKFWVDYYKESLNHDWMGLPLGQSVAPSL